MADEWELYLIHPILSRSLLVFDHEKNHFVHMRGFGLFYNNSIIR